MAWQEKWTDRQILEILHLSEGEGLTASEIAARMHTSRNAVLGIIMRVRDGLAASEAVGFAPGTGPAVRVGNRDGDLPPRWWAARGPAVPVAAAKRVAAR